MRMPFACSVYAIYAIYAMPAKVEGKWYGSRTETE